MKKILIVLCLWIAPVFLFSIPLTKNTIGFSFFGGLGWGGGVASADSSSDIALDPRLSGRGFGPFQDPEVSTGFAYNYGAELSYFILDKIALVGGVNYSAKSFQVLYRNKNLEPNADQGTDYRKYLEYDMTAAYINWYFGLRFYTEQEYLFGGNVFLGAGAFYGIPDGNLSIKINDRSAPESFFYKMLLFSLDGSNEIGKYEMALENDFGLYAEAGLNFQIWDRNGISFFVRYEFGLSKMEKDIIPSYQNPGGLTGRVDEISVRSFQMMLAFNFFFGGQDSIGSSYKDTSTTHKEVKVKPERKEQPVEKKIEPEVKVNTGDNVGQETANPVDEKKNKPKIFKKKTK
jgi:hypothetical protein